MGAKPPVTLKSMHLYVWEFYNGKRPDGYHVHHKDEDTFNNCIDNLVLIKSRDHLSQHMKKRVEENVDWFAKVYERTREGRQKWEKTEEAKQLFKTVRAATARKTWENRQPKKGVCLHCCEQFEYKSLQEKIYCSGKCKDAHRIVSRKYFKEKKCVFCGKIFYSQQRKTKGFCSRACVNTFSAQKRKNGKNKK